jgi:hypothetical protein
MCGQVGFQKSISKKHSAVVSKGKPTSEYKQQPRERDKVKSRTLPNLHRRWWILKLTIARWGVMIGYPIENNTLRATHIKSKEIPRRHVTGYVILFVTICMLFIYMRIFSKMKSRWKIKSRPQNSKDKAQIALEKTSLLQHLQTNYIQLYK